MQGVFLFGRKSGAPLRKENRRKKLMLSILLVLLAPFAVIWDALHAAVSFVARRILGRAGKRGMAVGMLGTASCLLLLSADGRFARPHDFTQFLDRCKLPLL